VRDGGIFRESVFEQRFDANQMNVPSAEKLPGTDMELPYVIVADEAFPLKSYIHRPYPGRGLSLQKQIFNYRLSRARRVIENTFDTLVARWRILRTTIKTDLSTIDVVKACVCLHNYCKIMEEKQTAASYCPPGFVDTEDQENGAWRQEVQPLQAVGRLATNYATRQAYLLRDRLASYFDSPNGQVPWQVEYVTRGRFPN
jgi:hypothetical protein